MPQNNLEKIKRKVLTHLYYFKREIPKYHKFVLLAKLIGFLFIFIIILKENFLKYLDKLLSPETHATIESTFQKVFQNQIIVISHLILIGSILLLEGVHIKLCQIQLQLHKFQTSQRRLLNVILVMYLLIAAAAVPALFNLGKNYSQQGKVQSLIFLFFNVLSFWPFSVFGYQHCPFVFDISLNIVVPCLSLFTSNYKFLVVGFFSVLLGLFKTNKIEKVLYVTISLICGWNFVDNQFLKNDANSGKTIVLLMIASVLILGFLMLVLSRHFTFNSYSSYVSEILGLIENSKTQVLMDSNSFEKVYQAWQICLYFIHNQTERQFLSQFNRKEIKSLTKSDLIKCLKYFVEHKISSQKDVQNRILYLKLKIYEDPKLIEIIGQIENLMTLINKKTLSLKDEYLLLQFSKYIEDKLFLKGAKQLKTSLIIEKATVSQQFYYLTAEFFTKLSNFWEFIKREKKSTQQISKLFDSIIQSESKLKLKYHELTKLCDAKKQRKIMIEIQNILNGHAIVSQFTKNTNQPQIIDGVQRGYFDSQNVFILLQGNTIVKASFEFLNEFKFSEEQCLKADKSIIFGNTFNFYFQKQVKNVTVDNTRVFILPVFNKQKQIMVKNCSIYIYPELKGEVKYLVSFNKIDQISDFSLVLYSTKSDSIEIVNNQFIEEFRLNKKKIDAKIAQSKILSSEIFSKIDLSASDCRQLLKQKKHLNCELLVKNIGLNARIEKYNANISLITQLQIQNDVFYMLSIKKGNFVKTEVTLTDAPELQQPEELFEKNMNLKEFYKDEKFFCKINNSYSIKITEKQSQLTQKNRRNAVFFLKVLFIAAILAFGAQIILFFVQSNQKVDTLRHFEEILYQGSQQYIEIQSMYSLFFKLQYFTRYPNTVQMLNSNITDNQKMRRFHLGEISTMVGKFLDTYLNTLKNSRSNQISYEIKFDYFQVDTDTSKSTLIDFSEKFGLYAKNLQNTFLFQNYLNFRQLCKEFDEKVLNRPADIRSNLSEELMIYSLCVILGILLLSSCFLTIKIQSSIGKIYNLLELLQRQDSNEVLDKIDSVKQGIKEISSIGFRKQFQSDFSKFSTAKIIQFSDELQTISTRRLFNQSKKKLQGSQSLHSFKSTSQEMVTDEISEQSSPLREAEELDFVAKRKQDNKKAKQLESDPLVFVFLRNFYYVFISILVGILVYSQLNSLTQSSDSFQQLFRYQSQLRQVQILLTKLQNDFYFKAEKRDIFEETDFEFTDKNLPKRLRSYIFLESDDSFNVFNQKQYDLLFGDICSHPLKLIFEIQNLQCRKVSGGILSEGFSQAFSTYFQLSQEMQNLELSQFIQTGCINEQCPPFIEAFYINIQLRNLIDTHTAKFREFFFQMSQHQKEQNKRNLIIHLGLVLICSIGFSFWIRFFNLRCVRAVKVFQIIPPNIMKKMKLTNFIRKSNLLSSLNIL